MTTVPLHLFSFALLLAGVGCTGASAAPTNAPALAGGPPTLHPRARVTTTLGDFVIELDAEKSPLTVMNFVDYTNDGFYDGTVFHRVVRGSVAQGGGYTADMTEKTAGRRPAIPCESFNGLTNDRWTVAMYREPGKPQTARTQFFINLQANPALDRLRDGEGYAVFGKVVEGIATVERIRDVQVGTHSKYAAGKNPVVPVTPVVIQSIRMLGTLDRSGATAVSEDVESAPARRLEALLTKIEAQSGAKFTASESGLRYLDTQVGNGAFPTIEEAVELDYRGTLVDGTEFDSSRRQGDGPLTVNVSALIAGLREGLETMREGGKRTLVVPPELGYGTDGIPGRVPADSTLIVELELFSVKPAKVTKPIRIGDD